VLNGQALAATPALWRYGLIRDGLAQSLPAAAELIALASQRTLDGDGAAPTEQGLRTLGLDLSSAPPAPPPGQPLFFVDHALIPDPISCLIPDLILVGLESERPSSAAECARSDADVEQLRMAGTPGILSERSEPSPNPPMRRQRVVAEIITRKKKSSAGAPSQKPSRRVSCARSMPSPAVLQNSQLYPLNW